MFAYIAGSPFVLQDVYGVSEQSFSLVFGVNAAGIMSLSFLSGRIVERVGPAAVFVGGLALQGVGAAALVVAAAAEAPLGVVLLCLFCVVASIGLVFPSATTLALADHPDAAGSASGLLGVCQYLFGALAAPLVGLGGEGSALPLAIVIAACSLAAAAAYRAAGGEGARRPCPKLPRVEPDAVEMRVLGCLLEKQRTTPDAYPLTLNSLRLACNQATNRDPVVDYSERDVRGRAGAARQAPLDATGELGQQPRDEVPPSARRDARADRARARGPRRADAARTADARRAQPAHRAAAPLRGRRAGGDAPAA